MGSNDQPRDVARRSWDTEAFERRAAARRAAEAEAEAETSSKPRPRRAPPAEHQDGDPFAPTRAWLRPRVQLLDIESRVGAVEVVSGAAAGGFSCKSCGVLLKDSNRFLAHINSRAHQKRLGVSVRVRRCSADEVRAAFRDAVRRRDAQRRQAKKDDDPDSVDDVLSNHLH